MRVYVESCTWRVADLAMDQRKEQRVASGSVQILGKVLQKPSKWFNKASGTKPWDVHRCFSGMPGSRPVAHQLKTMNTPGDPQVAQLLKPLHEFKRSFVRIDVGPFVTLQRSRTPYFATEAQMNLKRIFYGQPTKSTQQSSSWKSNNSSAIQHTHRTSSNPVAPYSTHRLQFSSHSACSSLTIQQNMDLLL